MTLLHSAGIAEAQPDKKLQLFWEALATAVTEKLPDGSTILTLQSSAFPGEGGMKKLLVRDCYVDLADMVLKHFEGGGHVFVLNGNPGEGFLGYNG